MSDAEYEISKIFSALDNQDVEVRRNAARALRNHYSLHAVLRDPDVDPERRQYAALAIGILRGSQAFGTRVFALPNADLTLGRSILEALGELGDPRAISLLIAALEHSDVEIRKSARWALIRIGKLAVPALIAALLDPKKRWRWF